MRIVIGTDICNLPNHRINTHIGIKGAELKNCKVNLTNLRCFEPGCLLFQVSSV